MAPMTEINDASFLARFPNLLTGADTQDIARVVGLLRHRTAGAGEPLIVQGGHSESLFLIVQGRLRVQIDADGRRLLLGEVKPGGWVGELSLIKPAPASATVTALEDVHAWALSHKAFEVLRREHPRTASRIIQTVALALVGRLRSSSAQLIRQVGQGTYTLQSADDTSGMI
ncbi:MAG: cyclic nucleotide-binding domain-containing protein [Alphaproteobacteria bacterium]|nr:cyclic nucleotide-binding domain-containing protein [Alphaproteobacteria bacterium]